MNLIIYQKVDPTDPRSYNAASRNDAYAQRRNLRFFKYSGDDVFGTVLQEMKVDEECEGAIVLFEHERLTVDGLEKKIDGLSFRVNATPTRDFTEKLGKFFFRKNEEGLAKLEEFASSMKSGVPTKGNEDGNSYGNESDHRERVESIARERGSSAATSPPPESKDPKKTKTTKSKKRQKTE